MVVRYSTMTKPMFRRCGRRYRTGDQLLITIGLTKHQHRLQNMVRLKLEEDDHGEVGDKH